MPGIVRKLLIFAAANGLILQPLTSRNQRAQTPIQINYESHSISPALHDVGKETLAENDALTAHGVLGTLAEHKSFDVEVLSFCGRSSEYRVDFLPHLHISPATRSAVLGQACLCYHRRRAHSDQLAGRSAEGYLEGSGAREATCSGGR